MQSQTITSVRTLKTDQNLDQAPEKDDISITRMPSFMIYLKSSSLSFHMAKKKSKNAFSPEKSQREHVTSMQKSLLRIHKSINTNPHLA
ncbi:hypothetical protein M9Y10_012771 [Tritrichomonas musculus]|uniref:Uncharacterized protein n=1 Tax=Tritrichomonas musculus TaxID=1915356 RepID=A0ABR2IDC5_9EUKA